MRIFAIGDLHLPGGQSKPMDVFGEAWEGHPERIAGAWRERVGPGDLVLVPGDISWAMRLEEAAGDLAYLGGLPGQVVMVRGNHDYWWSSIGKVRRALPPNVVAIQNDHFPLGTRGAICGTRGWVVPGYGITDEDDERLYQREVGRLELSLQSAAKAGRHPSIVMMHFPPVVEPGRPSEFARLLSEYGVAVCVYGHLHGEAAHAKAFQGRLDGVDYVLASCDAIGFAPLPLLATGPDGLPGGFTPLPGSPLERLWREQGRPGPGIPFPGP